MPKMFFIIPSIITSISLIIIYLQNENYFIKFYYLNLNFIIFNLLNHLYQLIIHITFF